MTRPISGRCRKKSSSRKYSRTRGDNGTSSGGRPKMFIQSLFPLSVNIRRLIHPPMLWPITTIGFIFGNRFSTASSSLRKIAAEYGNG